MYVSSRGGGGGKRERGAERYIYIPPPPKTCKYCGTIPRTRFKGYVSRLVKFGPVLPSRSPPMALTPEHARKYQLHLLEKKVSWSTFNQSVCALRFLYGTTLGRKDYIPRLPFGKKPKRIPVVLSRDEVLKLLQCIPSRKQRMLLTTMYATGMRVGEAVQLRVTDIDSRRMTILVARGKGNKQRLVPLSPKLLTELRLFWQTHRNPVWLFPGRRPDQRLSAAAPGRALQRAKVGAAQRRRFSTHALRHTFATELLEAGVDLFSIQKILGHRSLTTTALYTHVRRSHLQEACQSLDLLPLEQLRQGPAPALPGVHHRDACRTRAGGVSLSLPPLFVKSAKSSAGTEPNSSPPADPT